MNRLPNSITEWFASLPPQPLAVNFFSDDLGESEADLNAILEPRAGGANIVPLLQSREVNGASGILTVESNDAVNSGNGIDDLLGSKPRS